MKLYKEIEKSFPKIEKLFYTEDLLEFKNASKEQLYFYHFGIGTWIRNTLLYPKESILHLLFLKRGITDEDDMSYIIIKQFHQYIQEK